MPFFHSVCFFLPPAHLLLKSADRKEKSTTSFHIFRLTEAETALDAVNEIEAT